MPLTHQTVHIPVFEKQRRKQTISTCIKTHKHRNTLQFPPLCTWFFRQTPQVPQSSPLVRDMWRAVAWGAKISKIRKSWDGGMGSSISCDMNIWLVGWWLIVDLWWVYGAEKCDVGGDWNMFPKYVENHYPN